MSPTAIKQDPRYIESVKACRLAETAVIRLRACRSQGLATVEELEAAQQTYYKACSDSSAVVDALLSE